MRSSWPVRVLLPTAQVLAEGGWLAVVYAALQAFSGDGPAGRADRAGAARLDGPRLGPSHALA